MPLYEYACVDEKCGKTIEKLLPVAEADAPLSCECGAEAKRKISRSSFTLKGGGWASDGYTGGSR